MPRSLILLTLLAAAWPSPATARGRRAEPRPPTAFRYADAAFKCHLALDDFRGDQRFEVTVLAGRKVVHARSRDEARRPGVLLYWRGEDRRWHPWGVLPTTRMVDKCRLAEQLERSHWPLDRLFDGENVAPYLYGRLLCDGRVPRAVEVGRGHGPRPRRRVTCALPDYLRSR